MDPISLIVTALATGAASGTSETAAAAIKDGYASLKALIRRRFGGDPAGQTILEEHAKAPDVWKAPLEDRLRKSAAGEDEDIVAAARSLLELADPDGAAGGKYHVVVTGGQVGAIGDGNRVEMGIDRK